MTPEPKFNLASLDKLFLKKPDKPELPKLDSPTSIISTEGGLLDFGSKLAMLRQLMAEDGLDLDTVKMALKDIKEQLVAEPTQVAEMLPEDIGLLVQALFKTENLRILEEASKAVRKTKTAKGKGKAIEIDEDNLPF